MIKQEMYKLFIKNKMLLISVLFLIISTALTLVDALFISRPDGWCMEYIYVNESGINWLLIFVIMIAVRQSYVIEFESRMDSYLLTSKKGYLSLNLTKILTILFLTIILSLASGFITLFIYGARYGVGNILISECGFEYEITVRSLSALSACIYSVLINAVGYATYSLICIFLATVLRETVIFMTVSLSVIIAPVYLVQNISDRIRLPLPTSLISGTALFRGSLSYIDEHGNESFLYKELGDNEIISNILLLTVIAVALVLIAMLIFCRKVPKIKFRALSLLAVFVFSFTLTGCSTEKLSPSDEVKYYVKPGSFDEICDIESGKEFSVNVTPFSKKKLKSIYGEYAVVTEPIKDSTEASEIKLVNLTDFSERVIMTIGTNLNTDGLLGLDDVIGIPNFFRYDNSGKLASSQMILYQDKLYIAHNNEIIGIDINLNTQTIYKMPSAVGNLKISDNGFYYVNEEGELYNNDKALNIFPERYYVYGERIFCTLRDEEGLFCFADGDRSKLSDDAVREILYADEGNLYCFDGKKILEINY